MDNIGILDYEGKNNNPLTGKPYSQEYKELAKKWSNFPAYKIRNQVIEGIKENNVILCIADTGSGKTVLIPKYALHALEYKGNIIVTLPKQIIAKSAAEFNAKTLDVTVGKEVGYQYKNAPSRSYSREDTKILYATDGTLVARLMNDITLNGIDIVIIDEAHERKTQIDFAMYLLKQTLKIRKNFKVIIMSATINADLFKGYFSEFLFKEFNISGEKIYPIRQIFCKNDMDYKQGMEHGMTLIRELTGNKMLSIGGDILYFVTSSAEAMDICKKKNSMKDKNELLCVEVYAGMDDDKQDLATDKTLYKSKGQYGKKLVVATNVAESSLTIDGIKYVIDSGYELNSSYDPILHARRLDRVFTSKAQIKQRMGRAGRTEPGTCFHLYSQSQYNSFLNYPLPDIKKVNLVYECLKLLNMNSNNNITENKDTNGLLNMLMDFIEPPLEKYIRSSIDDLTRMNLIVDNKISNLGKMVINIGADDIYASLAIIYGKIYGCVEDIINIVCYMSASKYNMGEILNTPSESSLLNIPDPIKRRDKLNQLLKEFNNEKNKIKHKYGDHLSLNNILKEYKKMKKKNNNSEWGLKRFLKMKTLEKTKRYSRSMSQYIKSINTENIEELEININDNIKNMSYDDKIMSCLALAYKFNIAKYKNGYRTIYTDDIYILNQSTFMNSNDNIKNVLYGELFIGNDVGTLNITSIVPDNIINII